MTQLRLPNITAATEQEQLRQICSYLYQFVGELNYALSSLEGAVPADGTAISQKAVSSVKTNEEAKAQDDFNAVKSLIIKSADIVEAYYDEISRKMEAQYLALSEYGEFKEKSSSEISANAKDITALFKNEETITSKLNSINGALEVYDDTDDGNEYTIVRSSTAWVKIGVLSRDANGDPIYGMEIGQNNSQNGQTIYDAFARYCSDGVHLFDENGTEVAFITQGILNISHARISQSLIIGDYRLDKSDGLAFDYIGGQT